MDREEKTRNVLGIDIGGVIIERADENSDTSFFGDDYLETPPTPDVFEVLARLVSEKFGNHVYVVSKCGESTQERSLEWLRHHRFYERTGIAPERVRFCRERAEKGPIAMELGITHFVDDTLEVLGYLTTVEHRYLYRPRPEEVRGHSAVLPQVHVMESWKAIADAMLPAR